MYYIEREGDIGRDSEPEPPFRPSISSLCHPCITTTHLSYGFSYLWNFGGPSIRCWVPTPPATAHCRDWGKLFLEPREKKGWNSSTGIANLPDEVGFDLAMLLDLVVKHGKPNHNPKWGLTIRRLVCESRRWHYTSTTSALSTISNMQEELDRDPPITGLFFGKLMRNTHMHYFIYHIHSDPIMWLRKCVAAQGYPLNISRAFQSSIYPSRGRFGPTDLSSPSLWWYKWCAKENLGCGAWATFQTLCPAARIYKLCCFGETMYPRFRMNFRGCTWLNAMLRLNANHLFITAASWKHRSCICTDLYCILHKRYIYALYCFMVGNSSCNQSTWNGHWHNGASSPWKHLLPWKAADSDSCFPGSHQEF